MADILKGIDVANNITEQLIARREHLNSKGITPMLAIVRVGEDPSDLAYERGALNRAAKIGVDVKRIQLPTDVTTDDVVSEVEKLNHDEDVDGILIFRPLPAHIDDEKVRNSVAISKDVDCISDLAMAGIYSDRDDVFSPCTARACVELLKYYGIEIQGSNIVILGRSLVIGKPVGMLLLKDNATVTICHSRSRELEQICKNADILISAVGRAGFVKDTMVNENQIILDVGINVDDAGNMVGDVNFESVCGTVAKITPVPGGIGSVTTTILMEHTICSAEKRAGR